VSSPAIPATAEASRDGTSGSASGTRTCLPVASRAVRNVSPNACSILAAGARTGTTIASMVCWGCRPRLRSHAATPAMVLGLGP
jgi:hypothetical protein